MGRDAHVTRKSLVKPAGQMQLKARYAAPIWNLTKELTDLGLISWWTRKAERRVNLTDAPHAHSEIPD
jgi:hypothetical protein